VTGPPGRDAVADGDDPAGALEAGVGRRPWRRRVAPLPLHQVRAVDAAGGDLDDHIAGARDRIGNLKPAHDFGFTGLGDDDGAHVPLLRLMASRPVGPRGGIRSATSPVSQLSATE